jgi:hypothetical protein
VVLTEVKKRRVGSDFGTQAKFPRGILIGFHSPPIWSPSPVLQLVLEQVWSLVGFNSLCNPKATWRKVLSSLLCSMVRISVTVKSDPSLSFKPGSCHLGDRAGGVRDPGDA